MTPRSVHTTTLDLRCLEEAQGLSLSQFGGERTRPKRSDLVGIGIPRGLPGGLFVSNSTLGSTLGTGPHHPPHSNKSF